MDTKQIKALAELMAINGLTAIKIEEGDSCISIERAAPVVIEGGKTVKLPVIKGVDEIIPKSEGVIDFNSVREIKSPMVGVFYAAASPEGKPFVAVGDKVKKGDIVCIIEAMKLMNEITAEEDGEIVDICVKSGDVVEFSQPLFKLF